MLSPAPKLHVESNLVGTHRMTIDALNPEMYKLMFKQMYTYPEMAVLRELLANALDSHVAAGCPDRPIEVQLPSILEPVLIVRDFGTSMTHEFVLGVFSEAGGSSKREDNTQTGRFGIGSKSPFTITDSFTMICYLDGVQRAYTIAFDEDELPGITLLDESPTDQENGVEFIVPVEEHRVSTFQNVAPIVAMAFDVPPVPPAEHRVLAEGENWRVIDIQLVGDGKYFVRQGCVFYPVPRTWIEDLQCPLYGWRHSLIVDIPLGTANIGPDRESLGNDEITKQNVRDFMYTAFEDIRERLESDLARVTTEPWLGMHAIVNEYLEWVADDLFRAAAGVAPNVFSQVFLYDNSAGETPKFITGKHLSSRITAPTQALGAHPKAKLKGFLSSKPIRGWQWSNHELETVRHWNSDVTRPGVVFLLRRPDTTYVPLRVTKYAETGPRPHRIHVLDNPSGRVISRIKHLLGLPWEAFIEIDTLPFDPPKRRTKVERVKASAKGVNLCTKNGTAPVVKESFPEQYLWCRADQAVSIVSNRYVTREALAEEVEQFQQALELPELPLLSFTELAEERLKPDPAFLVSTFFGSVDRDNLKEQTLRQHLGVNLRDTLRFNCRFELNPSQWAGLTGLDERFFDRRSSQPRAELLVFCGLRPAGISTWRSTPLDRFADWYANLVLADLSERHPLLFSENLSDDLFQQYLSHTYTDTGITTQKEG